MACARRKMKSTLETSSGLVWRGWLVPQLRWAPALTGASKDKEEAPGVGSRGASSNQRDEDAGYRGHRFSPQ
jgi:hypothetical protein